MDIGPKIKEFVTTWAPITKVLVSIVIVSATVSTLYAKINNRLDNNKASIDCITKNTEEMDIEVDKFKAAMIKQTEQLNIPANRKIAPNNPITVTKIGRLRIIKEPPDIVV